MHWYDWHTVTERLQGRSYALTRGRPYKVILDPNTLTGCCDFTNKQIIINPNVFSDVFESTGLSGPKLDEANFLVSRAITGHEALHVLYSDPAVVMSASSNPDLKMVLNLLEDARIEKIGSEMSHVSKTLFAFVNRIAASHLPKFSDLKLEDAYAVLGLLLRWRLGVGIPALEGPAAKTWAKVFRLAERVLYTSNPNDVLAIAKKIVRLLGLGKASKDSDARREVENAMNRMPSDMSGSDGRQPLPNPLANQEPEENADDGTDKQEETQAEEPAETADQPPDGSEAPDDATPDAGDNKTAGEPGSTEPQPDCSESEESDGEQVSQPMSADDIEKLVDDTAMHVSEDLSTLVPDGSKSNVTVAKSKPSRGRPYSDIVASPYMHYLPIAAPIAAEVIRDLKAENPRAVSGPSQYSGRFKARYFVRDSTKPFAAEHFRGISTPKMALTLILDRSGSMDDVVEELRVMAIAITMACETLGIALSIWALEGQVHIKSFDEHGPQVLAKLAGIRAETLTRVMPTIRDAAKELSTRPESLKQIVMIHDGMPSDRMDFIEWRIGLRDIGMFCMFIMQQGDYELYRQSPEQLRENMDAIIGPRCYAIAPVTDIAKHWCSFVRNKRSAHSSLIG